MSRFAIGTLAELFKTMKKHMDQEVEEISRVLLQKAGDSSEFIQKAADQSLGVMARSVTPSRALAALMANGSKYVISFALVSSSPSGQRRKPQECQGTMQELETMPALL